ncbi:unnamed protein product [Closterium sp. NIES-65]|nr:unnamed protein product [Closterium sp. NIES-65]
MGRGSNHWNACKELMAKWPHTKHVLCATHVRDLLMEDVGQMPWVRGIVEREVDLICFIRNHHFTRGYPRSRAVQGGKGKQGLKPAGTRFGTLYIPNSQLCEDPEKDGGGEGGDDEDDELEGLEPEEVDEGVGEGGGVEVEAASQHVAEGGESVGVKVQLPGETFPRGGYVGVPDGYAEAWPHAKSWPNVPQKKGKARRGEQGSGGIERFMTTKLSQAHLRQAIAKLVVTCDLPFRIVESEAFRELLVILNTNCAKKNFIPLRWTVLRDTVVFAEAALQAAVAELMAKEGELGCKMSFTIDMWTAPNGKAWLVVTSHWIDKTFQLHTAVLEFREMLGRHTGEEMAQVVEEMMVQWRLQGCCLGLATDNASSNIAAFRRASFRLGSVFNGQEIGWDDAIATRRREEVREWESQGPGPVTEEQGTRGKEKDPDWRPAPGEAAGTSGGSGDEGWGGRGGGQAGGSGARGSGAAAKRPRTSGPVGSGAGGAGPASNSQPQGAAAGGSEGSGAAGAGTSATAAGGAPLGGSAGAGASQRSDRAGRTPTDEELDPWTEEVLRNAEPGLVRGMFSEKDVKEARNCKICKKKISWKGSCTSTGKRHLKRSHYPSLQIWCRRFKDPNKPDNLTFPDGGWGPDVPDQTAWPWEHAATWPRIVQTPDSAVTGGSEAGGSRQMSMAAFVTPRVHGQQLREGLVQLFAAADLPFRLVECREFKAFVQMLNPGAALLLGSRHRLARDMQAYGEAAREDMRQLLVGDGLAGRMSLTFDIWTSENNVAFMGVTANYVTSDFQLKQAVIDFTELKGSHTRDLIADELEEVLREWGLEKMLFAVTCDNAENNSRAMRLLAGHPPLLSRWRHFRYYGAVSVRGPPGSRRPSGPLRLIVDCLTRWGSTLHMVNGGFELRMPIAMFFDDSDVRMSSISKETKKAWDAISLTDAHWDDLAELRDFLTPFEQVTLFAEGSLYPTLSAVVPQYNALIDLQEKARLTPGISPLRSSLITAALSKLE